MTIGLASDHAGYALRQFLAERLRRRGDHVQEVGATSQAPYDYPSAADLLVPKILQGEVDLGVVICGTGIGISIRANRHPGIRAAVCTSSEMATLARQHNHANVLALGARTTNAEQAWGILEAFLTTPLDEGERHVRRISLLDEPVRPTTEAPGNEAPPNSV